MKKCIIENCYNDSSYLAKGACGYCNKHYQQIKKYGKPLKRTRLDKNEIIDCGDYYEICLYAGHKEPYKVARVMIDKEDLDKVKNYKWSLSKVNHRTCYATSIINGHMARMHHLILGKPINGYEVDHIDNNGLNNRKNNLRIVTHQQNSMNRYLNSNNISGKTGVFFDKKRNNWRAEIKINYANKYLGNFNKKNQAILARQIAEKKYFGKYAYSNN